MIERIVGEYKRSDRDIDALTYVVIAFLLLIVVRAAHVVYRCQFQDYECRYEDLWLLLPQAVPLLSVLVVVRVANRLLSHGNILREEDRRLEIARTTHHLIAIAKDLKERVGYVKSMVTEGGRPALAVVEIAKSIERRYETLLERDAYKYLPGSSVDLITGMSGSIFGIVVLAGGFGQLSAARPGFGLAPMPARGDGSLPPEFDKLTNEIQLLIDQLYEIRYSIEAATPAGRAA